MFKNEYQGGTVVEIFSAQGKDPVAKWKLCGAQPGIKKEFDKEVRGFVYCLEGNSQTIRMQMPKNGKTPLGLVQRFLVLQVNVPQSKDFSIELLLTDLGHLKRRLYLSTVHKEFSATPLHARIPFIGLKREMWSNVCIDLVSFTGELFKGAGYLTLDGITVCASCKLRRIFTMKTEPAGALDSDVFICGDGPRDTVPRSCQFPPDVQHVTQVLNMDRLRLADGKTGLSSSEGVLWASQEGSDQYHEPQLSLEEEVFTFSSRPHSARRGPGDVESPDPHNEQVESAGRKGARPEDDFLGSESDESWAAQLGASPGSSHAHQATHREPTLTSPTPTLLANTPPSKRAGPAEILPIRCLSPSGPRSSYRAGPGRVSHALGPSSSTSLNRRSLREIPRSDSRLHKALQLPDADSLPPQQAGSALIKGPVVDEGGDRECVGSRRGLGLARGLRAQEEEEEEEQVEQRMLASLRREQQEEEEEEEEEGAGLSNSQVGQCDISISTSSDDTSTWTHVAMPAKQGHHYQKEMNPLLNSNPREWMDVLSPPIVPPGRWRESGDSWDPRKEHPARGAGVTANKEENEEEYLNLLYDPCLNCYFDPATGKYYELA
ncbi:protein CFAP20DC [Aplochiton taeniatus]